MQPDMVQWSKQAVLRLYKQLIIKGVKDLKYTDKNLYFEHIRKEFRHSSNFDSLKERQRQLDKGFHFLEERHGKLL